jgi:photosystem II 13kDa protein
MKFFSLLAVTCITSAQAFVPTAPVAFATTSRNTALDAATMQFVRGLNEKVVPNVKLTRAKDGSSGVASFTFNKPNVFDASTASQGDVTGFFMEDEEGEISTNDVNARFSNGKPQVIECTYVMKSPEEWDRFMRFMERYGAENGLGFNKA